MSEQQQQEAVLVQHPTEPWGLVIKVPRQGSDPELTQPERLILALRAQAESLQSALDANTAAFDCERAERIKAQSEAAALAEVIERRQAALVPLTQYEIGELAEKYAYRDFTNDYLQVVDDLVRDVEATHRNGLTAGSGGAK